MSRPIRPDEVAEQKVANTPDVVFDVVNELIALHYHSGRSVVDQQQIEDTLVARGLHRDEIYEQHWMDFESAYREAGWHVVYEKPGYNENGRSFFTFTREPRNRRKND